MGKPKVTIDNWSVVDNVMSPGFRELEPGQRLTGNIFGHAGLPNGIIYTSVILSVDEVNGLVETSNSVYQLGPVSEDYRRWVWERRCVRAA